MENIGKASVPEFRGKGQLGQRSGPGSRFLPSGNLAPQGHFAWLWLTDPSMGWFLCF